MADIPNGRHDKPAKAEHAFKTISEVADMLGLAQHVLRFWETRFSQVKPLKRGGNRRYYRPDDIRLLETVRVLLHDEGYTIKGVQHLLKEQGVRQTIVNILGDALPIAEGKSRIASATEPETLPHESGKIVRLGSPASLSRKQALSSLLTELKSLKAIYDAPSSL